jgi:hypothetical protein
VERAIAILSSLPAWQRVAVVGLVSIPLILATVCCVPALILLPFMPGGAKKANALISKLIAWTKIILSGTQTSSA